MIKYYCSNCLRFITNRSCEGCPNAEVKEIDITTQNKKNN